MSAEDEKSQVAQLEDLVRRAYELLLETDHRIPDKQVIIHDLVEKWRMDVETYVKQKQVIHG